MSTLYTCQETEHSVQLSRKGWCEQNCHCWQRVANKTFMQKDTSSSLWLLKTTHFLGRYTPVTVEGEGFAGEVHLLQLLLIAPAGVLHSQVDVAGVGTRCIAEDAGGCLPHADAHLLSLYTSYKMYKTSYSSHTNVKTVIQLYKQTDRRLPAVAHLLSLLRSHKVYRKSHILRTNIQTDVHTDV